MTTPIEATSDSLIALVTKGLPCLYKSLSGDDVLVKSTHELADALIRDRRALSIIHGVERTVTIKYTAVSYPAARAALDILSDALKERDGIISFDVFV